MEAGRSGLQDQPAQTVQSQAGLQEMLSNNTNKSKIKCETVRARVHDCLGEEIQGYRMLGEKGRADSQMEGHNSEAEAGLSRGPIPILIILEIRAMGQ